MTDCDVYDCWMPATGRIGAGLVPGITKPRCRAHLVADVDFFIATGRPCRVIPIRPQPVDTDAVEVISKERFLAARSTP